jgi:hypothetical protein
MDGLEKRESKDGWGAVRTNENKKRDCIILSYGNEAFHRCAPKVYQTVNMLGRQVEYHVGTKEENLWTKMPKRAAKNNAAVWCVGGPVSGLSRHCGEALEPKASSLTFEP